MINNELSSIVKEFDGKSFKAYKSFLDKIDDNEYISAANLILDAENNKNRIHITGVGKPGHVSTYGASLLSSTGTPTYFLHATEAVHGSCGQLVAGDVVIAISNSGETAELKLTVSAIKNNKCKVIAITGNSSSWLAKNSDAHIFAGVDEEGDFLNRAPRTSILAEVYAISRLSLYLQEHRKLTPEQYIMWHPGGALGVLRENEK